MKSQLETIEKNLQPIAKDLGALEKTVAGKKPQTQDKINEMTDEVQALQVDLDQLLKNSGVVTEGQASEMLDEAKSVIAEINGMSIPPEEKNKLILEIKNSLGALGAKLDNPENKAAPDTRTILETMVDGVDQTRTAYLDVLAKDLKERRAWQGFNLKTIKNKVGNFFAGLDEEKYISQKHPNLKDLREKYDYSKSLLFTQMVVDKKKELAESGKDPAVIEAELKDYRTLVYANLHNEETSLLNTGRMERMGAKRSKLWKKTLEKTAWTKDAGKFVGKGLSALATGYRKLGDWGPGITIKDKQGKVVFKYKLGQLAQTGFIAAMFPGAGAALVGVKVARGFVLSAASQFGMRKLESKHEAKIQSIEDDRKALNESLSTGAISAYAYEQKMSELDTAQKKAGRRYNAGRAAVMLGTVGAAYGSSHFIEHPLSTALSGDVPPATPHINPVQGPAPIPAPATAPVIDTMKPPVGPTIIPNTPASNPGVYDPFKQFTTPGNPVTPPVVAPVPSANPGVYDPFKQFTPDTTHTPEPMKVPGPYQPHAPGQDPTGAPTAPKAPVSIPKEAYIDSKHNVGVTYALKSQFEANKDLADKIGYTAAPNKAQFLAEIGKKFGYIGEHGEQIGVKAGMGEAYYAHLDQNGNLEITEYKNGVEIETHHAGDAFESKAESYEYTKGAPHNTEGPDTTHNNSVAEQIKNAPHNTEGPDAVEDRSAIDQVKSAPHNTEGPDIAGNNTPEPYVFGGNNQMNTVPEGVNPGPYSAGFLEAQAKLLKDVFSNKSWFLGSSYFDTEALVEMKKIPMTDIMDTKHAFPANEMKYVERIRDLFNKTKIDYQGQTVDSYLSKVAEARSAQ